MAQEAATIPPKGLGTINWQDAWKTIFLAAATNVLLSLYSIINSGAWPTHSDLTVMLKATIAIIIANLIKVLGTNNVGEMFQKDKPIVKVNADELNELKQKAQNTTP